MKSKPLKEGRTKSNIKKATQKGRLAPPPPPPKKLKTMTKEEQEAERIIEMYDKLLFPSEYTTDEKYVKCIECALIHVNGIIEEGAIQYGVTAIEYGREEFWYKVKSIIESK